MRHPLFPAWSFLLQPPIQKRSQPVLPILRPQPDPESALQPVLPQKKLIRSLRKKVYFLPPAVLQRLPGPVPYCFLRYFRDPQRVLPVQPAQMVPALPVQPVLQVLQVPAAAAALPPSEQQNRQTHFQPLPVPVFHLKV